MNKLLQLIELESKYKEEIAAPQNVASDGTNKFYCTFPYPYMNGCLHLGHGYTITGCEFSARYNKSKGKNVLFPFGFHGSGMPIVSAAKRLCEEVDRYEFVNKLNSLSKDQLVDFVDKLPDNVQIKILYNMNVNMCDICKFMDSRYWVPYFTNVAMADLKMFDVYVDFSRSFYTTDANPYYNSFVTWQFEHLINSGYVYRGTRNIIYSMKDDQSCADHDRQFGEGVKPVTTNVNFVDSTFSHNGEILECKLLVTTNTDNILKSNDVNNIIISMCNQYKVFKFIDNDKLEDKLFVCNECAYDNIRFQCKVQFITDISANDIICDNLITINKTAYSTGTGFHYKGSSVANAENNDVIQCDFKYDEPESQVISRSGDVCIVANVDQWLVNYSDERINKPTKKYITEKLILQSDAVRKLFEYYIDWLNEWPCSRSYGHGTFIPNTTDIIDSLSDSTIYMAFYTIYNLITEIPKELVTSKLWDKIFLDADNGFTTNNETYDNIVNKMITEFKYWYPLDLRVSGKDLIGNHLSMTLLNHSAIWNGNYPKEYFVNGHLLLNGKKMSKSTGNFLTMRDCIDKFGSNATRLALANSFVDETNDGDFRTEFANAAVVKLHAEIETLNQLIINNKSNTSHDMWEKIFHCEMITYMKFADKAYDVKRYREVITNFNMLIASRDKYVKRCKKIAREPNWDLMITFYNILTTVMYPICPSWCVELCNIIGTELTFFWNCTDNIEIKYMYFDDILNNAITESQKKYTKSTIKENKIINIITISNYSDEELEILRNYNNIDEYLENIKQHNKQKYGKYKSFVVYVNKNVLRYGIDWINWVTESLCNEFELLNKWLNVLTSHTYKIETVAPNDQTKFKFGPGNPIIKIIQ